MAFEIDASSTSIKAKVVKLNEQLNTAGTAANARADAAEIRAEVAEYWMKCIRLQVEEHQATVDTIARMQMAEAA